jgi:hypothetical protein
MKLELKTADTTITIEETRNSYVNMFATWVSMGMNEAQGQGTIWGTVD